MKWKKMQKWLAFGAVMAVLAVCGCGGTDSKPAEALNAAEYTTEDVTEDVMEDGSEENGRGTGMDLENADEEKAESGAEAVDDVEAAGDVKGTDDAEASAQTVQAQELAGNVVSMEAGRFMISECVTKELEDGTQLAISVAEVKEEDLIAVNYTDETTFIIRATHDGLTAEDRPATKDDLTEDAHVILSGQWADHEFQASEIVIFILDM